MILGAAGDQVVLHAPGYLLVLAIVLPVAGVLLSFLFGGRYADARRSVSFRLDWALPLRSS